MVEQNDTKWNEVKQSDIIQVFLKQSNSVNDTKYSCQYFMITYLRNDILWFTFLIVCLQSGSFNYFQE